MLVILLHMEKFQSSELSSLGSVISKLMLSWLTCNITMIINTAPKNQKRKLYCLGNQIPLGSDSGNTQWSKKITNTQENTAHYFSSTYILFMECKGSLITTDITTSDPMLPSEKSVTVSVSPDIWYSYRLCTVSYKVNLSINKSDANPIGSQGLEEMPDSHKILAYITHIPIVTEQETPMIRYRQYFILWFMSVNPTW